MSAISQYANKSLINWLIDWLILGGDILVHIKADTHSLAFEADKAVVDSLPEGSVDRVNYQSIIQFNQCNRSSNKSL